MGKNKALAHHTSAYFHTRRVSIQLSCFRSQTLAGAPFALLRVIFLETFLGNTLEGIQRSVDAVLCCFYGP